MRKKAKGEQGFAECDAFRKGIETSNEKLIANGFVTNKIKLFRYYNNDESGPKWTVLMGQSERSLKWTVPRKWTVRPKVDGLEPKWTVF